jgi:hypothetical protein
MGVNISTLNLNDNVHGNTFVYSRKHKGWYEVGKQSMLLSPGVSKE